MFSYFARVSLLSCFRYHTGTLAFGSLILAIIQIIRVLLEYLDHKLKGLVLILIIISCLLNITIYSLISSNCLKQIKLTLGAMQMVAAKMLMMLVCSSKMILSNF